jgi:hypothetical protein
MKSWVIATRRSRIFKVKAEGENIEEILAKGNGQLLLGEAEIFK